MLNNMPSVLYRQLMDLCESSESFHFKDFVVDNRTYRIFNYRLASWTEFQKPGAMNCRGIMYCVTDPNTPVLLSAPMEKFFNYEEGTIDHTLSKMHTKMVKMDGSLISSYTHLTDRTVRYKSKASLSSDQAIAATKYMARPENAKFAEGVKILEALYYTVNFEYTAPTNRVVVPYQDERMTVISVRDTAFLTDFYGDDLVELLKGYDLTEHFEGRIVDYETVNVEDQTAYVDQLRQEETGEGYVISLIREDGSSYRVKVKNHKYLTLHSAKDSAQNPKRLCEAVLDEVTDDLRSLFADDQYILDKIAEMEQKVIPVYNHMQNLVDTFYAENKDLDRKSYAIKAKESLGGYMSLAMNAYIGRPVDYKEYAKKNMVEMFDIKQQPVSVDGE